MTNILNSMKMNWKTKLTALLVLSALVFSVSCGKGGEPDNTPLALPTPAQSPKPLTGGVLTLPMPHNALTNKPYDVNTEEMLGYYSLIFEGLIRVDNANMIIPALAETWNSDETGRIWTFNLRQNVFWHNGNDNFISEDVVYTFDTYSGEDSYYSYAFSKIEDIEAVDDHTLTITMKEPGLSSLYSLNFPIVDQSSISSASPKGTGPYYISGSDDESVTLTASDNWWRSSAFITNIVFQEKDSNTVALASFSAGQLNMVSTNIVSAGKYREDGVVTVLDVLTQNAELLVFNHNDPFFANINLRKAIAFAINRSEIVTNVYMNRGVAVDVPIPPDSWAYEPKSKIYDFNVETALELLALEGYEDRNGDGELENQTTGQKLNIKLLVNDTIDATERKQTANMIALQLEAIGITVEVVAEEFEPSKDTSAYIDKLNSGDFQIALVGINLPRDGDISSLIKSGGQNNFGEYRSDSLEQLIEDMLNAPDQNTYKEKASAMQIAFSEDIPLMVLCFRQHSIIYSAEIKGVSDIRKPDIFRNAEKWYIVSEDMLTGG